MMVQFSMGFGDIVVILVGVFMHGKAMQESGVKYGRGQNLHYDALFAAGLFFGTILYAAFCVDT